MERTQADVPAAAGALQGSDVFHGIGLIRSKLTPSRLPSGAIARASLIERFQGGSRGVLTLVSAPAGYGKTTLLTEWFASRAEGSTAWVSLDRDDTDPVRLWSHLIAALADVEPGVGLSSLADVRAYPDDIVAHALPKLLEELPVDGPDLV